MSPTKINYAQSVMVQRERERREMRDHIYRSAIVEKEREGGDRHGGDRGMWVEREN